jgi:ComEC/Rec2-related protein
MNTQNRIILFCYAYVAGIVLAKALAPDAVWLPVLWVGLGASVLGALAVAVRGWRRSSETGLGRTVECLLLVVPPLLFGAVRYMQANTLPDRRIGLLKFAPGSAEFRMERDLPDLSRISVRKVSDLNGDLVLRIHGELDARLAITNEQGLARMDAQGRWMFRKARVARPSEAIVVRQWDPVGTEYVVPQPFSRVTKVEIMESPGRGEVALYRVSNHIGAFARPGRDHPPVTLLGRITKDPDVYDFKTVLTVTPDYVQTVAGGPFFRVEGGDVQVVLKTDVIGYDRFARTEAYGKAVVVQGELTMARAAANPGGFNPRGFMQNHNIYGVMSLFQPPNSSPPICAVEPEGRALPQGNPLVRFSLNLRDRMLRVFKLTIPYPQSAFLGGVTLGLRYGLAGVECLLSAKQPAPSVESGAAVHTECRELIAEEFKASGVNHVLAVSGLHVTIVTVMFMGLFALLRIPRQMYVPVLILILVIFAIITGARPSVLRAVIMHGLFLLTWAYAGQGLRSSVLLGVPVAAFLILLQNPLVVVDPSFTLSFGAILSLGILTEPIHDLLSRLRGNRFLAFLIVLAGATLLGVWRWPLLVTFQFWPVFVLACAALWTWLARLEDRGVKLIGEVGFSDIPPGVGAFLAAQFAIQIGMMIPLSAYYFCRWPFAGAYANLIAIPLIGIVVQLGVLSGLVGLIPAVGLYGALLLNAANWVFSSMFLLLAHYFSAWFPFPFVRRPSVGVLVAYYLLCAAFVWRTSWTDVLRAWCRQRGWTHPAAFRAAVAGVLAAATIPAWPWFMLERKGDLRITVLSLGYGESVLIQTPAGRAILVDAGFVEHERGRKNDAVQIILPFLSHKRIRTLDAVLLTSPAPERISGLAYVLEHVWARALWMPPALERVTERPDEEDFYRALSGGVSVDSYNPAWLQKIYAEAVGDPLWPNRLALAKVLARRGDGWLNRWAGCFVPTKTLRTGDVVWREQVGGKEFRIEVVSAGEPAAADHPIENSSAVLRVVYGAFSMLLTGDLHFEGQRRLSSDAALRADVLLFPHHGTAMPWGAAQQLKADWQREWDQATRAFVERVCPRRVIVNYGNPRPVLGRAGRDVERVFELTWRALTQMLGEENCWRTDRDMAIFVTSDGEGYDITSQARLDRAAGADEEAADLVFEL